MNSGLISTRHQVDPKKELSRILRTDVVVKGIERKANSKKYLTLWRKAVLEALDEAIKENRWQSALKIFNLLRKQHWYERKKVGSCWEDRVGRWFSQCQSFVFRFKGETQ